MGEILKRSQIHWRNTKKQAVSSWIFPPCLRIKTSHDFAISFKQATQFSHKPKGEPFLCRVPSWESVDFVRVQPSKGQRYIKAEHITLEGVMLQQEANQSQVSPLAGVHFLLLQTRGGIISAFVETVTSGATWHHRDIHFEPRHQREVRTRGCQKPSPYHPGALRLQANLSMGTHISLVLHHCIS